MTIKKKVWLSIIISVIIVLTGLFIIPSTSQKVIRDFNDRYRMISILNDLNHTTYMFTKGDIQYGEIMKKYDEAFAYAQKMNLTDLANILREGKEMIKTMEDLFKRNEEIEKQVWYYSEDSYQQSKKYTEDVVAKMLKGEEVSEMEKKVIVGAHTNTTFSLMIREKFLELEQDIGKAKDLFAFLDKLIENSKKSMEQLKGSALVELPKRATINNKKIKELTNEYVQNVENIGKLKDELSSKLMAKTKEIADEIQSSISADIKRMFIISLMVFLILTGVVFFIIVNIVMRFMKDMNKLFKAIDSLSTGDLTVRLDITRKDEIGAMGERFNKAVETLQGMVGDVVKVGKDVENMAGELSNVSEEMKRSLNEVLSRAKDLIEGASESAQSVSASAKEMTTGIEEIATSAQNLSISAQGLSEKSQVVKEAAERGNEAVQGISEMVEQTNARVKETDAVVSELVGHAENIETILETITSIAEQTNLLALNAAIEAARAGEAGKGFAVVADEIRKLAEESKKATNQIAQTLTLTREGVEQARQKTNEVVKQVEASVGQVNVAIEAFKDIQLHVNEISSMINEVTASSEELSATSQEMNSSAATIMDSMVKVANGIEELSVLYGKLKEAGGIIGDMSGRLMELVKILKKNVDKFTV